MDVLNEYGINVSLQTVQRTLRESQIAVFGHLKNPPKVEQYHINRRLKWAKKHNFTTVEE